MNPKVNVSAIWSEVVAPNLLFGSFSSFDTDKKFSSNIDEVVSFHSSCDLFTDAASCGSSRMACPSTSRTTGEQDDLEAFRKVKVNIPILEVVSQIPSYTLRTWCANKVESSGQEEVSENVCMLLFDELLDKCVSWDI